MAFLWNLGPGWFQDIFDIEIEFATGRYADPHEYFQVVALPLFESGDPIEGSIRLIPRAAGSRAWHRHVLVQLESIMTHFETGKTISVFSDEQEVAGAGYTLREERVPFKFNLSESGVKLQESYEGDKFAIRHSIRVSVQRPWYTFDVTASRPFIVQMVTPDPAPHPSHGTAAPTPVPSPPMSPSNRPEGSDAGSPSASSPVADHPGVLPAGHTGDATIHTPVDDVDDSQYNPDTGNTIADIGVPAPKDQRVPGGSGVVGGVADEEVGHDQLSEGRAEGEDADEVGWSGPVLVIPDCHGVATFDYGRVSFTVDDTLEGALRFTGLQKPVVRVELSIIKLETCDGLRHESILFDEALMDSRLEGQQNLPIESEGGLMVSLALGELNLSPTYYVERERTAFEEYSSDEGDSSGEEEDPWGLQPIRRGYSVRYFLRLTVYTDFEEDNKFWNTHEIILFRSTVRAQLHRPEDDDSGPASATSPRRELTASRSRMSSWADASPTSGAQSEVPDSDDSSQARESPVPGTPRLQGVRGEVEIV